MEGFRDIQKISEKSVLALGTGDSSWVQGHSGPAQEKEKTMNTSTRKKILTVAGALAIAGALVAGVVTNGSDKKDSTAVEQLAEFEAMLNDGVIDQGTLESFLTDIADENSPINNTIKELTAGAATNMNGSKEESKKEPKLDAAVSVKDDAPAVENKPAESVPVSDQQAAQVPGANAQQPAAASSDQAGAATTPEAVVEAQPGQPSEPSQGGTSNSGEAQQTSAGGATSTAIPQWMLDLAKSKTVNILDVYKSWQSNGGTFSGVTNPTLPTQPTVPGYTEICRRLGTC